MLDKKFIKRYPRKERDDWVGKLLFVLIIIGFIFFAIHVHKRDKRDIENLKDKHVYSIATVRDYTTSGKNGIAIVYTFFYKDSVYIGHKSISRKQKKTTYTIGKRYLVVFNPDDPATKFFLPYPVYDSIMIKREGWKRSPTGQTELQVFKYLESNY